LRTVLILIEMPSTKMTRIYEKMFHIRFRWCKNDNFNQSPGRWGCVSRCVGEIYECRWCVDVEGVPPTHEHIETGWILCNSVDVER
jgi:hypothetical protein